MPRNIFLRSRHQKQCRQPFRERDFAFLKNGFDRDGELLAAGIALVQAGTMHLAAKFGHTFTERAAMRAERTVRPDPRLEPVEQMLQPELRGLPIAVGGGVVLAASYEAKAFGIVDEVTVKRAVELEEVKV
jgi:hypothetical protein